MKDEADKRPRKLEIFDHLDSLAKTGHSIELIRASSSPWRSASSGCCRRWISTLGFKEAGGHIYNSSFYCEPPMIIVDVSTETLNKVAGKTVYPPAV